MEQEESKAQFVIQDILPIALTLVVAGIGIAYGLNVMEDVKDDTGNISCDAYWNTTSQQCEVSASNTTVYSANPASYNASVNAIDGVAKLPEKLPLIVTVIVAAIIIGILVRYLMVKYS